MNLFVVGVTTLLMAQQPAETEPSTPEPTPSAAPVTRTPEACTSVIEEVGKLFDEAIEVLAVEFRKEDDADPDVGAAALREWVAENGAAVRALRTRASELHEGLSPEERTRCERSAYRAFHRSLTRFATVSTLYHHRRVVFRMLGDLFY